MQPLILWTVRAGADVLECTLVPGCAGIDLDVRRNGVLVRRERYPDRGLAAERAAALRQAFAVNAELDARTDGA